MKWCREKERERRNKRKPSTVRKHKRCETKQKLWNMYLFLKKKINNGKEQPNQQVLIPSFLPGVTNSIVRFVAQSVFLLECSVDRFMLYAIRNVKSLYCTNRLLLLLFHSLFSFFCHHHSIGGLDSLIATYL